MALIFGWAKKLHTLLFDFSASENNRREVEDILLSVLAESQNDFDFEEALRRVITRYEGGWREGDARCMAFRRFMTLGERREPWRVRAEHLLEDLPRIYGGSKKARTAPPAPPSPKNTEDDKTTKENNTDV